MNRYLVLKPNKKTVYWTVVEEIVGGDRQKLAVFCTKAEAEEFARDMTMVARWEEAKQIVGCEFDI